MKADLAVINGLIVDSRNIYPGVLYIREGKIVGITQSLENRPPDVIDAHGLYILPGAIDGHVHMMDPGYTDREDFTTGTRAAARGGVTTVIDHHRTVPQVFGPQELIAKRKYLEERAVVDYGLLGGLSLTNLGNLKGLWEAGALGFKGFTCELHEADALLSGHLMEILAEIRQFNGIALFHCEDDSLLKKKEEQLRRQGRKDPLIVSEWRSPEAEELAVRTLIYAARKTGARVAVAHTSLPSLVLEQAAARAQGISVYTETCAQYLYLNEEDLKTQGPFAKFTPPPRKKEEMEKMKWCAARGLIDMVNSDHCPYPYADKETGVKDIWRAPFGIPGVETATLILLDLVSRGTLTLQQVAYLRSERPAMIYGLAGQKGEIRVGCDADLILADLKRKVVFDNARVVSKCGWTPYHGREVTGDVVMTMVRGRVVMKEGKVIGEPGWGRFVTRRSVS
ncbi:MAG TPA: dihydroorotase family protein [Thermodesulfobacteriota bacterium]|nr:dihydroorotase family protein [Thermodesulfobacteriota bacterium]